MIALFLTLLAGYGYAGEITKLTPPKFNGAVESYNQWKEQCRTLSSKMKSALEEAPYHIFDHHISPRCSDPSGEFYLPAEKATMHVLVANLFYFVRLEVRKKALQMLEEYNCKKDGSCDELADVLDLHVKATHLTQNEEWQTCCLRRVTRLVRDLKTN